MNLVRSDSSFVVAAVSALLLIGFSSQQIHAEFHHRRSSGSTAMPQNAASTFVPNPQLTDPALNKKVDALLEKMTLEEKVGQLVQFSVGAPTGPGTGRQSYDDMIAAGQVGALLNVADAKKANEFQHIAVEKSRLHIP